MKTARQLRRAEERRLRKKNRLTTPAPAHVPLMPSEVAPGEPTPEPPAEPTVGLSNGAVAAPARAPISEAKRAANQANAQLSTGPRTAEGKEVSSRNRFIHGFTGAFCVLPAERTEIFEQLVHDFFTEHAPVTVTERVLVTGLVQHYWLAQRAIRYQDDMFRSGTVDPRRFALLMRYQTTHERAFHKCLNDLLRLKKLRKKEERGFESQTGAVPARTNASLRPEALEPDVMPDELLEKLIAEHLEKPLPAEEDDV